MQLPDELKIAIDRNAFCAMATHLNMNEIQNHLMWIDYVGENLVIILKKVGKRPSILGVTKISHLLYLSPKRCTPVGKSGERSKRS